MLRIHLLGRLRATVPGEDLDLRGARVPPLLLAYLLLHRHEPLPREHVAHALWPAATQPQALASLRRQLYRLQRLLPPCAEGTTWLFADRLTVQWNASSAYWLDVEAFEDQCAELESRTLNSQPPPDLARLQTAVACYTGDLLSGFYDDWILGDRERLRRLYGRALDQLLRLQAEQGDLDAALATAGRLVSFDSLHEDAHRLRIGLTYLAGDRAGALAAFEVCRQLLRGELDVEPMPETASLAEAVRTSAPAEQVVLQLQAYLPEAVGLLGHLPGHVPHNLPRRLTSFIGRERELAALEDLLCTTPLVTLIGPGGCGKSRLALEVAGGIVARGGRVRQPGADCDRGAHGPAFPDGVWWIDCAPVEEPELLLPTVASNFGLMEEPGRPLLETILDHVRPKGLLLILDNCEHLLAPAGVLAGAMVQAAAALRVVATSREPLGVPGELAWQLPPLSVPEAGTEAHPEVVLQYEAPRLFADRAAAVVPNFAATTDTAPAIMEICRRLDGLPLAIELAAVRVKMLSPAEIAARLDKRFRLLTGGPRTALPRHQTLAATVGWSYDLLGPLERRLFRRLAVFRGGWTMAAAEAVCVDRAVNAGSVPVLQDSLVARSLVVVGEADGGHRCRMLETIRQYALDRLVESGEADAVRARHLSHYLDLAQASEVELAGPRQAEWLARLEAERDNLDAALRWTHDSGQHERGLCLAGEVARFWELRGHFAHGRGWLDRLLALPGAGAPTTVRARALRAAGSLAEEQGDYDKARGYYQQALAISRQLDELGAVAQSLSDLGNVADFQADYPAARSLHEEALAIRRGLGDGRGIAVSLNNLGNVAEFQGEYWLARQLYEESLDLMRAVGDRWGVSVLLNNLGRLAMDQGQHQEAERWLAESLDIARDLGDRQGIAYALHNLGEVARLKADPAAARRLQGESLLTSAELGNSQGVASSLQALALLAHQQGQQARAVSLLAAADAVRQRIGAPVTANERAQVSEARESLRRALGDETFERAWQAGRAMSDAQATALALQAHATVAG